MMVRPVKYCIVSVAALVLASLGKPSEVRAQISTVKQSAITYRVAPTIDEDKWALIVAVNRNDSNRDDLSPVDGAERLATILTETYGYRDDQIARLTGRGANFKQILRSIQDLAVTIPRSASLVVFLSTNGVTGPYGEAYAMPGDGRVDEKWTLVPVSDLAGLARQVRSALIVSDNCALGSGLVGEATRGGGYGSSRVDVRQAPQLTQQMQQQARQQAPETKSVSPASQDFDVVTLCPESEPAIRPTRSLSLVEDTRRSAEHATAFLQGVAGRADVTSDGTVSVSDMIKFMASVGLPLNDRVQHVAGSSAPFMLIPQAESRFGRLSRLASNEMLSTGERQEALKSLSGLVGSEEGTQYVEDFGSLVQGIVVDPDQPSELRAAALDLLGTGSLGREWGVDAAASVLASSADSDLKVSALSAASRIGSPGADDVIRQALASPDGDVRAAAVDLVSRSGDAGSAGQVAQLATSDPVMSVRTAAITAFPAVESDPVKVAAVLVPLLQDENTFVRVQVMNALVKAHSIDATGALADILRDPEQQPYPRQQAAYALGKLAATENREAIVEALTSVLGRGESGSVREAAIFSLGQVGPGAHEAVLAEVAVEPTEDSAVRLAAVQAIGTIKSPTLIDPLTQIVDDSGAPMRLRLAAIDAIGAIGDPGGARFLYNVLEYGDPDLRDAAAEAIGLIKVAADPDLVLRLIALLGDEDFEIRENAIRSLTEITDDQAFEILLRHLNDKQQLTRRGVVEVLGRQGERRGFDPILSMISDPSFDVRIAAYEALGNLEGLDEGRDEKRHGVLLDGAYDREPAVRRAAMKAVRTIVVGQTYRGELEAARRLAADAASRVVDDQEATAWFGLFLLSNDVRQPAVGVAINAEDMEETAGEGWQSVRVKERSRVVTTFGNPTQTDLLVTSFALAADGQVDVFFLARWLPAGDQVDVNGQANLSDSGTILRTFVMEDGEWNPGRPDLDSSARLRDYLTRAQRAGALRSAGIVTLRVMPRPADDFRQMMKR